MFYRVHPKIGLKLLISTLRDGSPTRTVAYDIFYDECSYQAPCTAECASGRLSHLRLEGYVVVFTLAVLVDSYPDLQVLRNGTNGKYG